PSTTTAGKSIPANLTGVLLLPLIVRCVSEARISACPPAVPAGLRRLVEGFPDTLLPFHLQKVLARHTGGAPLQRPKIARTRHIPSACQRSAFGTDSDHTVADGMLFASASWVPQGKQ